LIKYPTESWRIKTERIKLGRYGNILKLASPALIILRECIVKEFENGMKIWFWKGIALKKQNAYETNLDIGEVAVSIDESYVIKRDDFSIPENIALTQVKF
jgi:hypothetical protein